MTVHRFSLAVDDERRAQLAAWLSDDERRRAQRFVLERARRQFVVARGRLRELLGAELGLPPAAVRLTTEPGTSRASAERPDPASGKPCLAAPHSASGVTFNLSHSGELGLLAITRGGPVGCDIECLRHEVDFRAIARRTFAPGEVAELLALPASEQPAAFYRCWTRKEAFIKLLGTGLGLSLSAFEVTLVPGVPAALRWFRDDSGAPDRWQLEDLSDEAGGHFAAVIAGRPFRLERPAGS